MLDILIVLGFIAVAATVVAYLVRELPYELAERRSIRNMTNPVMKRAWLRWQRFCDYGALAWLLFGMATLPITNIIGEQAHIAVCMITFVIFYIVTLVLHHQAIVVEAEQSPYRLPVIDVIEVN